MVGPTLLSQVFCLETWQRGVHMNDHAHSHTSATDIQHCYYARLMRRRKNFKAHAEIKCCDMKFPHFSKYLLSTKRTGKKKNIKQWIFASPPYLSATIGISNERKAFHCQFTRKSSLSMKLPNFPQIYLCRQSNTVLSPLLHFQSL